MTYYNPVYPAGQFLKTQPAFDYHSLMIFDSLVGRAAGQQGYPLVSTREDRPIIMGGNNDPDQAGPSFDDIDRLSVLYPQPPPPIESFNLQPHEFLPLGAPFGKRSIPENATEPTQPWLRVDGPGGFTTTIGPVPTEQPTEAPAANRSTKRWYSVPDSQNAALEALKPWPPRRDGRRVITWCHENQASMRDLETILAWGRHIWEAALHYPEDAYLYFANDPACGDNFRPCLCSTRGVSDESLRISVSQPGESKFDATLGYRDPIVPKPDATKPRHWLTWPSDVQYFGDAGGLMMAHLLGEISTDNPLRTTT